ncbi:MAG: hypothetical protein HQL64_07800 [Magnetococcales bacterium]|nr:hypothetical protein [Magnetococcales bacterium]
MKRLGDLILPASLQWTDLWDWSPVAQEAGRTLGGAMVTWSQPLSGGRPVTRHRFPVAVPSWTMASVDHTMTDESDNLPCRESHILRTRVNKVLMRGYLKMG